MDILIPYTGKNFVTDATMLTSIQTCGRKTNLGINQSLHSIRGKSNSLEVGSIMHKYLEVKYKSESLGLSKSQSHGFGMIAAELYISGCEYCTNFSPSHFTDEVHECNENCILKPKCNHPVGEYPGLENTPPESTGNDIGWKFVLQTCEEYNEFYKNDFWVTLDTEIVKSRIMYQDDDIRILFKSKLDWIVDTNAAILPCDHKTSKQFRSQLSMNNQFMGQCLNTDSRNVLINKIGWQKTFKPIDKFKRESISYSAGRLFEWANEVLPYWCKIALMYEETGYWPPNFNNCENKYGWCQFHEVCASNPDMRTEVLQANFKVGPQWNPQNHPDGE